MEDQHATSSLKSKRRFCKMEKNGVMAPSVSAIFKIQLAARDNMLERFSLKVERACR